MEIIVVSHVVDTELGPDRANLQLYQTHGIAPVGATYVYLDT